MHWIAAKVTFESREPALAAELVADLFDTLGISGVVVDDPLLEPIEGWGADAVPRPTRPAVTGYLPGDHRCQRLRNELEKGMAALATRHPLQYAIDYQQLDEQTWAESWKAFFHPQPITAHLVVKPTWCDYTPRPGEQVIEIDPGMAFGTGTHPTTALCVQLLENQCRPGQTVLDVGTGSGILLIAAAKSGAHRLVGVDNDPMALTVARKNLLQNGLSTDRFILTCGHLIAPVAGPCDLVVANILADVIIELLDTLHTVIAPGGRFICSGILRDQTGFVTRKMTDCDITVDEILELEEWVSISGRFNP